MKYKVVENKIIKQVADDYEAPTIPPGFPSNMQETIIDVADLGALTITFPTTVLLFTESLGGYKYTYENSTVVDNSVNIILEIKGKYHNALGDLIKDHLNKLNLNEDKTKRKYLTYLTDGLIGAYLTNFNSMNTAIENFLIPYASELTALDAL